jgi:hypothetical protein
MTACCPYCGREERTALLCLGCTATLRYELSDVPTLLAELDVTISRQSHIQAGAIIQARPATAEDETVASGLVHERIPIHMGAVQAADDLAQALTSWAYRVTGHQYGRTHTAPTAPAAAALRDHSNDIRKRADVVELFDGVIDAIRHARSTVDHPNQRTITVGPCPEPNCPGKVQAVLPADDKRPPSGHCDANPEHRWASNQFLRLGERIQRTMGGAA